MFGPCIILQPNLAASRGFCPPCLIIDPPIKTIRQSLKNKLVSPYVSTKYISVSLGMFFYNYDNERLNLDF